MFEQLRRLPRSLAYLYAGTIATRLGTFVVPYLTLYLAQGRGLTLTATGEIIAAGGVGLLAGNLLGGQLADRVGRKSTLLLAIALNVLGVAVLSASLPSGMVYAFALGTALAGAGMYTPAANALIADLTTHADRPLAFTVNYVCVNVGMGLGPLLGGLLAATSFGMLFAGDVMASLVCAALIAVGVRSPAPTTKTDEREAASTIVVWARHPRIVGFCLASIFVVAPLMGLEFSVPILVGRSFGEALVFVGAVYSINAVCVLALSFPVERLLRGRDEAAMMSLAGVLWALGLGILAVGFSITALLACTVIWTIGEIIGSIVIPTYISRRVPDSIKGRMLALQDAVRSVSAIACPIALGLIWDGVGEVAVIGVLVALPVIGAVVYAVWWREACRTARLQ